jgi:hypothetical protein
MDLTGPPSQLRQGGIDDNGRQPGRHFRLPLELVEMPTSRQECILDRILSIGSIPQVSISPSVKRRHVPRENVLHLLSFVFEDADIEALPTSDG